MLPTGLVVNGSVSSIGTGTSVPPLNGTGVLDVETKSVAGADGAAKMRSISAGAPASCKPVPLRSGVPKTPGRPEPSTVHVPESGCVNGTGSEAMPLATTSRSYVPPGTETGTRNSALTGRAPVCTLVLLQL